jgi:hypothetical protein
MHDLIHAEQRSQVIAIDDIHPSDALSAGRFEDMREQDADGALTDDGDIRAATFSS